jgi:glucokinase
MPDGSTVLDHTVTALLVILSAAIFLAFIRLIKGPTVPDRVIALDSKVTIDNNANTSALAEQWFGAGRHVSDFVLLNFGRGIGMGIVIDGELYRGAHHNAGEAGHVTVDLNGPRCDCGNAGCLGLYASVRAVEEVVQTRLAGGEPSSLSSVRNPSIEDVIDAFHVDDPCAVGVITDVIRHVGAGLASIINTYDPSMILIGRAFAAAGDRFFGLLRTEIRERLGAPARDVVRIEPAEVTHAPVVGAATLALRQFVRAPLAGSGG